MRRYLLPSSLRFVRLSIHRGCAAAGIVKAETDVDEHEHDSFEASGKDPPVKLCYRTFKSCTEAYTYYHRISDQLSQGAQPGRGQYLFGCIADEVHM